MSTATMKESLHRRSPVYKDGYAKGYAAGLGARLAAASRPDGVAFPIPLRNGDQVVRLYGLPLDLTAAEAERICAVVKALSNKDTP